MNLTSRTAVSVALLLVGCGGAAEPGGDASAGDAGLDAALADGSAYAPGDAARPEPSCGVPIRRLTIGGPRVGDVPSLVAGEGDAVVAVMPLRTLEPELSPLRIRETRLSDGSSHEASASLPDGDWNLIAAAALERPTALLSTVGGSDRFLWAELADGAIELTPLSAPSGVGTLDGSILPVSDGAAFLDRVRLDGAVAVMRIMQSGIDVVAVDTPPGSSRYRVAGSADAGSVFMAASGFGSEPRIEIARIGDDGTVLDGWQRVLDGEPTISLQATAGGLVVTAAFEGEVVIVRLDANLTESERLRLPLDDIRGAWTIEAPTPALLAKRKDPYSETVLFGRLPALDDLRALAEDRSVLPVGWARGDGEYAVAVRGRTATDVYLLCEEP